LTTINLKVDRHVVARAARFLTADSGVPSAILVPSG
jgi:hypothetical protein